MQKTINVSVIGSGLMGQQIALNAALCGYKVVLNDSNKAALEKAEKWANEYLAGRVEKGKLTKDEVASAKNSLSFELDLQKTVAKSDLVIEAIIENIEIKQEMFKKLDEFAPPQAILATNSSRIASSVVAAATKPERRTKIANFHYFNPALVMQLVEIVRGPHTGNDTIETLVAFAKNNKKVPIVINKEIDGFVVNRILAKVTDEALFLLEDGVATAEEIDLGCEKGLNYPVGPFKLMDITGIDLAYATRSRRMDKTDPTYDANYTLPKVLVDKFKSGNFGRKTGKGWYDYSK